MRRYDPKKIEKKWQKEWDRKKIYKTTEAKGKKFCYVLDMFPYPSGEGLHVGHPKGYIATDIYSRYKKMSGFNVLHPMGFDSFGLPAENYAIKNKIHPDISVKKNIKRFRDQLSIIGFNYDWDREIVTSDPEYYRWTQWIFLQMYKKGLAYEAYEPINWCPSCKTGLANEDLEDGKCERCGSVVEKKPMRQWTLRITDYAEKLLNDLKLLPKWSDSIKESQRNWIGKSEGAEVIFKIKPNQFTETKEIKVYTTRIDTIFSGTFIVLAPEHPLIQEILNSKSEISNKSEIEKYLAKIKNRTEIERTEKNNKEGVELKGVIAINPATNEEMSVWISDFVLGHYGTGAVFADAHDERDYEMAKKYNIPLKTSIEPLFIQKTGVDAVREELSFVERPAVVAIVKHWAEDKYLCLAWKKTNWKGFVMGGIDDGESAIEAAIREIKEETGYKNIQLSKELSGVVHSKFYHPLKNINRFGHFPSLVFTLQNGEQDEISETEKEIHNIHWIEKEKVKDFLNVEDLKFIWEQHINPKPFTGEGILCNSEQFNGLTSEEARQKIISWLEEKGLAKKKANYKLRDWVFSRQRYWGEPIPVIHCEKCGVVPVPEKDLPVTLPKVKNYEPTGTGESPLAAIQKWVNTKCPKCKGKAKRETNTMPQWAGSSWYYLRFIDPKNKKVFVDAKKEKKFMPVSLYVGGAEHATRHLIYARFWHKFLYDEKLVSTKEPFERLHSVGLIAAEDGRKMSKRYGNVVNPDDVINQYGADTLRVYEMFMGPFGSGIAWSTDNMIGSRRFLDKVWNIQNFITKKESEELTVELNKTIKKVEEDIENFSFNTAISSMMIFVNKVYEQNSISKKSFTSFLQLLSPFAPHITDEIWHLLGNKNFIYSSKWPKVNQKLLKKDTVTIAIQVNGKTRGTISIDPKLPDEKVSKIASENPAIREYLLGKNILKTIVVKGRIVNFVVN